MTMKIKRLQESVTLGKKKTYGKPQLKKIGQVMRKTQGSAGTSPESIGFATEVS